MNRSKCTGIYALCSIDALRSRVHCVWMPVWTLDSPGCRRHWKPSDCLDILAVRVLEKKIAPCKLTNNENN